MDAQEQATGQTASPGTLYPRLDEYRDDGLLVETVLAQGNRQQVDDATAVNQALAEYEGRLRWWLRLCRTARESLDI